MIYSCQPKHVAPYTATFCKVLDNVCYTESILKLPERTNYIYI